jgi:Asp-tRNA(Asn)/Glu-tRNA(Gln) amidotransferase A subunit family amidase
MAASPERTLQLFPAPDQTIGGVGRALREGRTTAVRILEGCLEQVDHWEPRVHAWVLVDRDRALEHAHSLDEELHHGKDRGPLHGLPIGIKDIIDVAGLPTACGSKRWAAKFAESDASVVASLREAGAVIMGKTVTTPYAWIDPPITRNPWNLERTPGGSSSGSAAAVATGMCLGAIGTQTGGSITRPASFCGVAGMKPTHGVVDADGILPFAPSLDHVGPIARAVTDLQLLYDAIRPDRLRKRLLPEIPARTGKPPRIARLRGFFDHRTDPAIRPLFEQAVGTLAAAGAEIVDLPDPVEFENILRDHREVMAAEAAGTHSLELDEHPDDYPSQIRNLIVEGRSLTALTYLNARNRVSLQRTRILAAFESGRHDAFVTPATIGTAPDPSTTGDPAFNSPWSYLGLPTLSFPIGLAAADGLPVALQLIGLFLHEDQLLRAASWCEQAIRTSRQ